MESSDFIVIIAAIFFPPLAVFLLSGCGVDLCINIILTFFGFIPGIFHAFFLLFMKVKAEEKYGRGGYVYVGNGQYRQQGQPQGFAPPPQGAYNAPPVQPQPAYGATTNAPPPGQYKN